MKLASICPYARPLRSQNILIGSFSGIRYRDFLLHLGPVAVLGLLLDWLVLWRLYFRARVHDVRTEIAPEPLNVVRAALVKAGVVAVLVLVGFLSAFPPPLVAAVGAAIMLITRTVDPHRRFYHSDRGAVEPGEQRARSDVAEVAGHSIFEPAHGMVDTCHGKHAAGNLTITGSVANIIVVERARKEAAITFFDYFRIGLPVTILTLTAGWLWLSWIQ